MGINFLTVTDVTVKDDEESVIEDRMTFPVSDIILIQTSPLDPELTRIRIRHGGVLDVKHSKDQIYDMLRKFGHNVRDLPEKS